MHMADALISPAVGITFLAASAGLGTVAVHRLRQQPDDSRIPMMGVMGAFVFSAQMINFSIPGTGSSGHLGGGLLLAAILGPHAAFLSIAAILAVQALLFGDGGLLALGCNIFNLGFFPCYLVWPLIYRPLVGNGASKGRTAAAAIIAAIVSLQAGAFSVVLQTVTSGRTELPFSTFVMLMQPIHLAIGIVEGLVTAAVVLFLTAHRPQSLQGHTADRGLRRYAPAAILLLTVVTGMVFSSFASSDPDGLEWSIFRATGQEALSAQGPAYALSSAVQQATALLPDYGFRHTDTPTALGPIDTGTAFSGLVGGAVTLLLLTLAARFMNKADRRHTSR